MSDLRVALWLQPRPNTPIYEALYQTIGGLRPLFSDGRKFEPHVTLVTGITAKTQADVDNILDRASAAAKSVSDLDVIIRELTFGSAFFRKVVLEVQARPELLSLAAICREHFIELPRLVGKSKYYEALSESEQSSIQKEATDEAVRWVNSDYKPHISLVYSNIYPLTEDIRHTVHQRLSDVFGNTYAVRGIGWTGGRLALVWCEGDVSDWKTLGYRDL